MIKEDIRIQMMDTFEIFINEQKTDNLTNKSKKGAHLIQFLILNEGEPVPNFRILSTLWDDEQTSNPENALKTLVSRLRTTLNQISPGLGSCLVADRGAYHWDCNGGITVDYYEVEKLLKELLAQKEYSEDFHKESEKLLSLYKGDLLQHEEGNVDWSAARGVALHNDYMSAVYKYIEFLKEAEEYEEIARVCRTALDVDEFDDRLHMELMTALIKTGRTSDALVQYKHVTQLNYRYLGVQPSDELQEFYKQIVRAGKTLDFNLESIRNELRESGAQRGAFVCEYAVFKEIFNLQMRNLERLGSTMFLGIVMVGDPENPEADSIKQNNIANAVLEIMQQNLRKGDTITHFSPTVFALLLPTVNYSTGNMVMERIKRLFYRRFPNSNVPFNYRVGPLSSDMSPEKK